MYRMIGVVAVAVSVATTIEFIVYLIHTYPLAITAIVIIFVAGGFYRIRNEYKRRSGYTG